MKITERQFQQLWDMFVASCTAQQGNNLYDWRTQNNLYHEIVNQQSDDEVIIKEETKAVEKKKFKEISEDHDETQGNNP